MGRNFKKGYSLTEVVVYTGLFILLSVFAINALLITAKSFARAREIRKINSSAEAAMERIIREIRLASAITSGLPGSTLTMDTEDPFTEDPTTISFALSGSKITVTKGSTGIAEDLTSGVDVTALTFYQINLPSSDAVKVEMTIEGKNFYGTALLRHSYN